MALGQVIGTIAGAGLGSLVPGGTAIGAQIGSGIGSMIDANKAKKDAEANFPKDATSGLTQYMSELQRKSRAMETGAAAQSALNDFKIASGNIVSGIASTAGGANRSSNLQMLALNQGASFNKVLAGLDERAFQYNSLINSLINKISDTRTQLGLAKYSQNKADEATANKTLEQTINAFIADQIGGDDGDSEYDRLFSGGLSTYGFSGGVDGGNVIGRAVAGGG